MRSYDLPDTNPYPKPESMRVVDGVFTQVFLSSRYAFRTRSADSSLVHSRHQAPESGVARMKGVIAHSLFPTHLPTLQPHFTLNQCLIHLIIGRERGNTRHPTGAGLSFFEFRGNSPSPNLNSHLYCATVSPAHEVEHVN